MLLTNGNIAQSKILKYVFLDLPESELYSVYEETHEQYTIFDGLHDASIQISENEDCVIIDFSSCRPPEQKRKLIFKNAKIISFNKVKRNGHIARLNKKVKPLEFGYQEIYTYLGAKYITLVLFYAKIFKKRSFSDKMLMTIRYDDIMIEKQ